MTNTDTNPYYLEAGYQPNHDIAITGYGLTIGSILHWLYDRKLETDPVGFYEAGYEEEYEDDYDEFFRRYRKNKPINLSYVTTTNAGVSALMMYDVSPSTVVQKVPTCDELDKELVETITLIYAVPNKYQQELKEFVDKYADYIYITDYC